MLNHAVEFYIPPRGASIFWEFGEGGTSPDKMLGLCMQKGTIRKMNQQNWIVKLAIMGILSFATIVVAQEATTIKITDKVKVKNCNNLGINFNASSSNAAKIPVIYNFEGGGGRQIDKGVLYADGFMTYWYGDSYDMQIPKTNKYMKKPQMQSKGWVGGDIRIMVLLPISG